MRSGVQVSQTPGRPVPWREGAAGGHTTSTVIVLHVPLDGSEVMAVSVPRDDYVDFVDSPDGQKSGKVKEAYGLAEDQEWNKFRNEETTDHTTLEQRSREAGRKSTIADLTKLLGVPIDHFAEVSLAGFYDLATQLGGVDVCLNHPTQDPNSGADLPAGRQHLNGAQALAFVRQRDNLTNEDLERIGSRHSSRPSPRTSRIEVSSAASARRRTSSAWRRRTW